MGRLCTVEGDAWFLPDTVGVSYGHRPRQDHHRAQSARPGRTDARLLPQRRLLRARGGRLRRGLPTGRATPTRTPSLPTSSASASTASGGTTPELVDRVVALTRDHLARRPVRQPGAPGWPPGCGPTCRGWPPGSRGLPPLLVRALPPVRRQHRAGRLLRRLAGPPRRAGDRPPAATAFRDGGRGGQAPPVRHGPGGPGPDGRPRRRPRGHGGPAGTRAMGVLEARYGG